MLYGSIDRSPTRISYSYSCPCVLNGEIHFEQSSRWNEYDFWFEFRRVQFRLLLSLWLKGFECGNFYFPWNGSLFCFTLIINCLLLTLFSVIIFIIMHVFFFLLSPGTRWNHWKNCGATNLRAQYIADRL